MPWMVGNVVRNLLHRPATRPYPTVRREPFTGSRGRIVFLPEKCEFCGDCERACPAEAIVLDTVWEERGEQDKELTWIRIYEPHRCIYCDACVEVCAYDALISDSGYSAPSYHRTEQSGRVEPW